jgi:monoamine oxidase
MRRKHPTAPVDVIVIGAGAAGLAAAGELARHGLQVLVLEARDRLGGRVLSVRPRGWPTSAELGAEFIHGGNRPLRRLLKRANLRIDPVNVPMWWHVGGELQAMPDFWPRIAKVARLIPWRDRGWSFAQFLRKYRDKIGPRDRRMMEQYIGGFNAAPLDQISAHALRPNRAGAKQDDFKLRGAYEDVIEALRREWPKGAVKLRLRSVVRSIEWRKGSVIVRVSGASPKFSARAVVVTLPLGVLQAGSVRFAPRLAARQKLMARLGWGHAVRVILRFRTGFWSARVLPAVLRGKRGRNFGFINAAAQSLPTWWALEPPAPVLTGWAGGDAAKRLERGGRQVVREEALRSLAAILGTTRAQLRPWLAGFEWHDWARDPFTRGAYSFSKVGLEDGGARLAEPVKNTVFFAGEATSDDPGTVTGAMASGLRVAKAVRKAIKRN